MLKFNNRGKGTNCSSVFIDDFEQVNVLLGGFYHKYLPVI